MKIKEVGQSVNENTEMIHSTSVNTVSSSTLENLKSIAHDLDYSLGGIGAHESVLSDVKDSLMIISQELDEEVHNASFQSAGLQQLTLLKIRREVKILSELMHFTMQEFKENFTEIQGAKERLFESTVKKKHN